MRYILLLLPFIYNTALAQQKETTVSISCYVNPELYMQAGVIAQVSDKAGNVSCNGKYISINNKSKNAFYYKINNSWVLLKSQGRTVIIGAGANNASPRSPSIIKLSVKYTPDASGNLSTKVRAITQMNAQTDQVKARELEGDVPKKPETVVSKPPTETIAKANKPSTIETQKTPPAKAENNDTETKVAKPAPKTPPKQSKPESVPEKKRVVTKAKPKTPPKQNRPTSAPASKQESKASQASATAVGLRIDFGTGSTGLGPNIKHRFNRKHSIDAAIVFFEGDVVGLGAQFERNFSVRGNPDVNWYIGIGPQFLFANENNTIALVPVTGLEFNIPNSPLNLSFDWRPNFHLSPVTDVQAGRFGLSLRVAF